MVFRNFANSIARTISLGKQCGLSVEINHRSLRREERILSDVFQVGFLADNSYSMAGNKGAIQLIEGLDEFIGQVCKDPLLKRMLEVSAWTYGFELPTEMVSDFVPAREFKAPNVSTDCLTYLWELVADGIDHTLTRMQTVQQDFDADTRAAWVFVASDFDVLNDDHRSRALESVAKATEAKVNLFLLGCGDSPNREVMEALAQPGRPPVLIKDIGSWKEFFPWLLVSLRQKSLSIVQQRIELPPLGGQRLIGDG